MKKEKRRINQYSIEQQLLYSCAQAVCNGAIRGSGRQALGATIVFVGFYVISIPLGCLFAFVLKFSVAGALPSTAHTGPYSNTVAERAPTYTRRLLARTHHRHDARGGHLRRDHCAHRLEGAGATGVYEYSVCTRIVLHCFEARHASLKMCLSKREHWRPHGHSQALIRAGLSRKNKQPRVRQPGDEELGIIGSASASPPA